MLDTYNQTGPSLCIAQFTERTPESDRSLRGLRRTHRAGRECRSLPPAGDETWQARSGVCVCVRRSLDTLVRGNGGQGRLLTTQTHQSAVWRHHIPPRATRPHLGTVTLLCATPEADDELVSYLGLCTADSPLQVRTIGPHSVLAVSPG